MDKIKQLGKHYATLVDTKFGQCKRGCKKDKWSGSVIIGDNTFLSEYYDEKEHAISELLGYLEGIAVQVQAHIEYLKKEIDNEI